MGKLCDKSQTMSSNCKNSCRHADIRHTHTPKSGNSHNYAPRAKWLDTAYLCKQAEVLATDYSTGGISWVNNVIRAKL